ncbi:MAG: putative metal-binding motif-containing protein, partial [Myxococcota bacterium]|nr:putative metal-binding motif-containing protein [Myxococcota bacterium]
INWAGSANPRANPAGALYCIEIDVQCHGPCSDPDLQIWYRDADGDGYGDPNTTMSAASAPAGHVADGSDCDDADRGVHPAGAESCDGLDNDCDGVVDEGVSATWYLDEDRDGYGNLSRSIESCAATGAFTATDPRDCDDTDAHMSPVASEVCDDRDNDCDGAIDEGLDSVFYLDLDGDGYGGRETVQACVQPSGTSRQPGDCDDDAVDIHPGAEDVCDHIDNDCDGVYDEDPEYLYNADRDNDGYGDPVEVIAACAPPVGFIADDTDCNDSDRNAFPGAEETCDGVDNNCDGVIDPDEACPTEATYTACSAEDGWNRELVHPDADPDKADPAELGPWATAVRGRTERKAAISGANWIWTSRTDTDGRPVPEAVLARPFELEEDVEVLSATLDIASDGRFSAAINGEPVAASEEATSSTAPTSWDVTDSIQLGWNRLEVDVEEQEEMPEEEGPPGLLYCLTIDVECTDGPCPALDDDRRITDRPAHRMRGGEPRHDRRR